MPGINSLHPSSISTRQQADASAASTPESFKDRLAVWEGGGGRFEGRESAVEAIERFINYGDDYFVLDLSGMYLSEMPPIPAEVEVLKIFGNNFRSVLPLGANVKALWIDTFGSLHLPELPPGVEHILIQDPAVDDMSRCTHHGNIPIFYSDERPIPAYYVERDVDECGSGLPRREAGFAASGSTFARIMSRNVQFRPVSFSNNGDMPPTVRYIEESTHQTGFDIGPQYAAERRVHAPTWVWTPTDR